MADFEDLRMIDLLKQFRGDIVSIEENRSANLFKQASKDLQSIYNFHITAAKSFSQVGDNLKNLYTSFNYSAVIINDALKKKKMTPENIQLLDECLDVMLRCCDVIIATLKKKK